jgi:hypothetical protein
MGQTREGAVKIAARNAGLTVQEYLDLVSKGLKKCTTCKRWLELSCFSKDKSRKDGTSARCKDCSRAIWRIADMNTPQKRADRRDGDKKQARARINSDIENGLRPSPNDLHCVFCGHKGPDKRHEYHHPCGYAPEHHYDILPVCSECHGSETFKEQERERDSQGRFK